MTTQSGEAKPIMLFGPESKSQASDAFFIHPGQVGLFRAFGFTTEQVQLEEGGFKQTPKAELSMCVWDETKLPKVKDGCGPDTLDLNNYRTSLLAEEQVWFNSCLWCLSACDNIALLDVPGSYRLTINDPSQVGTVMIFLKRYANTYFTRNSRLFFGEG